MLLVFKQTFVNELVEWKKMKQSVILLTESP